MQLDKIIELVDAVVGSSGFECIEAEFDKKASTLRLYMDWSEAAAEPLNLDHCGQINKALDEDGRLDDLIAGAYVLEVSSPGVERPLRREKHFRAHIGETIAVRLKEKIDGSRQLTGTLLSFGQEQTDLFTLETEAGLVNVPMAAVHKANIVYDWASS